MVEIPDGLFDQVKQFAEAHNLPLDEVVETGLRKVLADDQSRDKPFRLRDASFRGEGIVDNLRWPEIKAIMREDRKF
jgi:hypothetical protein